MLYVSFYLKSLSLYVTDLWMVQLFTPCILFITSKNICFAISKSSCQITTDFLIRIKCRLFEILGLTDTLFSWINYFRNTIWSAVLLGQYSGTSNFEHNPSQETVRLASCLTFGLNFPIWNNVSWINPFQTPKINQYKINIFIKTVTTQRFIELHL
jgi:hypothetical protein